MSIIDEIMNAPMGDTGGKYLPPGFNGKVRIESAIEKPKRDQPGVMLYIFEYEILESNLPAVAKGETYSFVQKKNDSAPRELRNIFTACAGFDPYTPEGQEAAKAAMDDVRKLAAGAFTAANTCGNKVLCVETYNKKTRANSDYTVHHWSPAAAAVAPATPVPVTPPPTGAPAEWQRDASKTFALNPATNKWHFAATGVEA